MPARTGDPRFQSLADYIVKDLYLVATLAAQQLIHRQIDRLAQNVPQRDIDGTHRRIQRRTKEMRLPRHDLKMMLYLTRILADIVFGQRVDGLLYHAVVRP